MAGLDQINAAAVVHFRRGAVQVVAEPALGQDEVDAGQHDQIGVDLLSKTGDHQGQAPQDGRYLLLLLLGQGGEVVVQFHHGQRLHEQGGAGAAGIMDHAGDLAPVFLLHRHHEDVVADGDDGVLQVAGRGGVLDEAVQAGAHLLRLGGLFPADGGQSFGGVVIDSHIRADGLFHRAFQGANEDQGAAQSGEDGEIALDLAEKDLGSAGSPTEGGYLHQLLRVQHAADLRLAQMRPDVPQAAAAEQGMQPQQFPGLVGLGQQPRGVVAVRGGTQGFRQLPGGGEIAVLDEAGDDLVVFQFFNGAFVHRGYLFCYYNVTRRGTGGLWCIPSSARADGV